MISTQGTSLSQTEHPSATRYQPQEKREAYFTTTPSSCCCPPSIYFTKIGKLYRGKLLVLHDNTTVQEALETMAKHDVASAPVLRKSDQGKSLLGFIDIVDILSWFCFKALDRKQEGEWKMNDDQIDSLSSKRNLLENTEISNLVDFTKRTPFQTLNMNTPLIEAVQCYLKGIHRIAIVDDNNDFIGVLSRWSVGNYLYRNATPDKNKIPFFNGCIRDSPYLTQKVFAVPHNENLINTILRMQQNKLSSLAMIDNSDHHLKGNFSLSDLRGFRVSDLSKLKTPIYDFVTEIRKRQNRTSPFIVKVDECAPVSKVIRLMQKEWVHRVYIFSSKGQVTGVVSLTDLMKSFVNLDMPQKENPQGCFVYEEGGKGGERMKGSH